LRMLRGQAAPGVSGWRRSRRKIVSPANAGGTMSHAIVLRETGGPDKLRWEEWPVAKPGPGEVRMRHKAVGLNFIDVYQRTGIYQVPMPLVIGQEGAGVVVEAGPGVSLKPGTRVGY